MGKKKKKKTGGTVAVSVVQTAVTEPDAPSGEHDAHTVNEGEPDKESATEMFVSHEVCALLHSKSIMTAPHHQI